MFADMKWKVALLLVAAVVAVGAFNYLRPIPAVAATSTLPMQDTVPGTVPKIPWPGGGSGVVGASGLGLIAMFSGVFIMMGFLWAVIGE